ncbi:MAG: tetratricopeptide repeat protein [bacterium]|jgi:tetratricopeptide (TPR) repeat protein
MPQPNSYAQHYRNGVSFYAAGHYEEALLSLKKSLLFQPDFPDVYFLIARIHTELNHYPDAISIYKKIVSLCPNDLEIQREYAKLLLLSGNDKQGKQILHRIIKKNPRDLAAWSELIRFYIKTNQLRKALSTADAGIRALPDQPQFYSLAGEILLRQNRLTKAQKYYEQALEIDSHHESAKRGINLVIRSQEQGQLINQRSEEDEVREEMVLAAGLFARGHYDEAIHRLLDLKNRDFVKREATIILGMAFARKGLYKRAYDVFRSFLTDHTPDIQVLYHLGLCRNRMGLYKDAIPYLNDALQQDEEYQEALIEMGVAHQMLNHFSQAREYFVRALKVDRVDPRPYAHLARLAYDRGNRSKVAEFFKHAQTLDPKCPEIEFVRGYIAIHERKFDDALHAIHKYLEICPDHFEALKLLGYTYLHLEDYTSARTCLQAAVSLNPSSQECKNQLEEISLTN